jgi:hypothetical protein
VGDAGTRGSKSRRPPRHCLSCSALSLCWRNVGRTGQSGRYLHEQQQQQQQEFIQYLHVNQQQSTTRMEQMKLRQPINQSVNQSINQ